MTLENHKPPATWNILDRHLLQDCKIFKLYHERCEHPQKDLAGDFYTLKAPDSVVVIPLTSENRFVLVNQYRFGIKQLSLEFPGGFVNPDESTETHAWIIQAGLRELREETGYTTSLAQVIGVVHGNPAIQSNRVYFVLAENCERTVPTNWDEHEELEIKHLTLDELCEKISSGIPHHSIVSAALFFYLKQKNGLNKLNSIEKKRVL